MTTREQYIRAATRANTRRSYQAAIQHFEVEWGGLLPATPDSITRYLTAYGETLALNTLKQRLAALAKWHVDQGFPDPTKAPMVRTVLKGIRVLHPAEEKQAKPIQLEQLQQLNQWLQQEVVAAETTGNRIGLHQALRNRALLLLGFWRGFRSDELCRLQIEHVQLCPGEGLTLFLQSSKGDHDNLGRTFQVPALRTLCPVEACQAWLNHLARSTGPLFPRIDRWGHVATTPMQPTSLIKWLRTLFRRAGIPDVADYSSHSLRRGFANWANANGWDMKTLMQYVGWRDLKSALRYLDAVDPFGTWRAPKAIDSAQLDIPAKQLV